MVNRSTIALALVTVALLAGCSGLIGDGAAGPDSPEEFEYADGYSADGVTSVERASQSHREAIDGVESFMYSYNVSVPSREHTEECTVDEANGMAYCNIATPAGNAEIYFEGDRRIIRQNTSDGERVLARNRSFNKTSLTGWSVPTDALRNSTGYETSVDEQDGTPVVVYRMNGSKAAEEVYGVTGGNVTAFSVEFSVDADGLIREVSYELTYIENNEEVDVSLSFRLSNINDTSVERPEWSDEA